MRTFVLVILITQVVGVNDFAWSSPSTSVQPESVFSFDDGNKNSSSAHLDSMIISPATLHNPKGNSPLGQNYLFSLKGLFYNGTLNETRSSILLIGVDGTFRHNVDSFYQLGLGLSDAQGIFFSAAQLWRLSTWSWAKPYYRWLLLHTSNPTQAFGSFLNYKNFSTGLGFGIQQFPFFWTNSELSLDVTIGISGVNYQAGLGYLF